MKARDILFPLEMYDVDFVLQRICHRRVLVSLLIVVLASFTVACGSSEVATVSTEDEAIEILTVLYDNGIDAYKKEEGDDTGRRWKIFVEEKLLGGSNLAPAHRVLRDSRLPRPADEGREAAAKEEGILKSGSADKARRLKEVETEIERQLRLLPAVVRVKANVAPAEEDPLATDPPPATASVVLICKDKQPTFADDHVQKLVAGSVPKLKPENVRVAVVYEPPRPAARRPAEESRRKRVITGIVLVSVLSVVLIGLVIQARRKRNNSAAPFRDPDESLPEHGGD